MTVGNGALIRTINSGSISCSVLNFTLIMDRYDQPKNSNTPKQRMQISNILIDRQTYVHTRTQQLSNIYIHTRKRAHTTNHDTHTHTHTHKYTDTHNTQHTQPHIHTTQHTHTHTTQHTQTHTHTRTHIHTNIHTYTHTHTHTHSPRLSVVLRLCRLIDSSPWTLFHSSGTM